MDIDAILADVRRLQEALRLEIVETKRQLERQKRLLEDPEGVTVAGDDLVNPEIGA